MQKFPRRKTGGGASEARRAAAHGPSRHRGERKKILSLFFPRPEASQRGGGGMRGICFFCRPRKPGKICPLLPSIGKPQLPAKKKTALFRD